MKPYLIVLLALFASPAVFAEKTLQECIDTENDLERLVCYDTIFGHSKGKVSLPAQRDNSSNTSNRQDLFGKEQLKDKDPDYLSEIQSVAVGNFTSWKKNMTITLQNGQVWRLNNPRVLSHKIKNPKVTIKRGVFGSYKLSIEGVNTQIKVKRVK